MQKLLISASRVLLRLPGTEFKLIFYKQILNFIKSPVRVADVVRRSQVGFEDRFIMMLRVLL